jgi:hypothetical protein
MKRRLHVKAVVRRCAALNRKRAAHRSHEMVIGPSASPGGLLFAFSGVVWDARA